MPKQGFEPQGSLPDLSWKSRVKTGGSFRKLGVPYFGVLIIRDFHIFGHSLARRTTKEANKPTGQTSKLANKKVNSRKSLQTVRRTKPAETKKQKKDLPTTAATPEPLPP